MNNSYNDNRRYNDDRRSGSDRRYSSRYSGGSGYGGGRGGSRDNGREERLRYNIVARLGWLEHNSESGWGKQANIIEWGDNPPKLDIRSWKSDTGQLSKGITLSEEGAVRLLEILADMYPEVIDDIIRHDRHARAGSGQPAMNSAGSGRSSNDDPGSQAADQTDAPPVSGTSGSLIDDDDDDIDEPFSSAPAFS